MSKNDPHFHKANGSGLMRIFKASLCSVKGFKAAYKYEAAFRQESWLCVLLFCFSFEIAPSPKDWLFLICILLFLLFAEIVNSAIEALADKITTEYDELIGRAKDLGSAAVFIAMSSVIFVWGFYIIEYAAGTLNI